MNTDFWTPVALSIVAAQLIGYPILAVKRAKEYNALADELDRAHEKGS